MTCAPKEDLNQPALQHSRIGLHCLHECITKTSLFKYTENFTPKSENFQIKNSDILHISAQNIDCEYSLEPPRRGGLTRTHNLCFLAEIRKIMYTPVNSSFTI